MRVLICGGGIVGVSIAYFLACRGAQPIVIERCGLACGASGKGGGFLALDWCDGTPLEPLARRSFALHEKLVDELDDGWGYRRLDTFAGAGAAANTRASLDWLATEVRIGRQLGSPQSTAQVHPGLYTAALMRAAEARGAQFRRGEVIGLVREPAGDRIRGALVDGEPVAGDALVIAMGPWSQRARNWLPLPRIFGLKGHSLVFRTGADVPPQAVFLEIREPSGAVASPDIFPRADGTTYICAISTETPLPSDPADVVPDPGAIERLREIAARVSPVLARSPVVAQQACYRPIAPDGLPLIGPVPGRPGSFVATGHSVWGILNAPATGEAMAELILDGQASAIALDAFDPARFV